ncbi:MAG: S8 family serine peptidase [Fimbriimonadaceae bacterium]|nr:S8 family serine peptidase [Fimbriimonadaceae bacterium]
MKSLFLLIAGLSAALGAGQGRILARIQPGADALAIASDYTITLADTTSPAPFVVFVAPPGSDVAAIQAAMRLDARIVWAEDDDALSTPEHAGGSLASTIAAVGDPNTLYALNANMLAQVHWNAAAALAPGRRVRVGILDTGLSPLVGRLWPKVVASLNVVETGSPAYDIPSGTDTNGNGVPDQAVGHGTMVAGLVEQVCPKVEFVIVRVADSDGFGRAWTVIKGMAYAVANGVEIVNVSLGAESIPAMSDVLDWVEERNVVVVAAVGNNGANLILSPAEIRKVVSVAGLSPDDTKAPFSNWGNHVRVSAPATGLAGPWWRGGAAAWSGTSFATPLVTGALANVVRRYGPKLPEVLRRALEATGDSLDGANPNHRSELGVKLNVTKLDAYLRALRRGR